MKAIANSEFVRVEVDGKPGVISDVGPEHIYVDFEADGRFSVPCRPTSVKFVEEKAQ